jgi:hypothetical protein
LNNETADDKDEDKEEENLRSKLETLMRLAAVR